MQTLSDTRVPSLADVTLSEFTAALTPGRIRLSQVIQIGLAVGVVLFLALVASVYMSGPRELYPDGLELVEMLTLVHVVTALIAIFLGKFLAERLFTPANLEKSVTRPFVARGGLVVASTPVEKCIFLIRLSLLLRSALLEGAALIGVVATIIAVHSGIIYIQPLYALNLATAFGHLVFIAATFPTADRYISIFEEKIQRQLMFGVTVMN